MKLNGNLVLNALGLSEIQNAVMERAASDPTFHASEAGRVYFNTTSGTYYYNNGTIWQEFASGGSAFSQAEGDAIEASLGAGITTSGTFNAAGFPTTLALTGPTSFTDAINQIAAYATANDTLFEMNDVSLSATLPAGPKFLYINGGNWVDHTLVLGTESTAFTRRRSCRLC
jgi:hypothetical protein